MHFSWVPILNHDLNFIPLVKQPGILNIFHEVEDVWRKATPLEKVLFDAGATDGANQALGQW